MKVELTPALFADVLAEHGGWLLPEQWDDDVMSRWSNFYPEHRNKLGEFARGELPAYEYTGDAPRMLCDLNDAREAAGAARGSKSAIKASTPKKLLPLLAHCLYVRYRPQMLWDSEAVDKVVSIMCPAFASEKDVRERYLAKPKKPAT